MEERRTAVWVLATIVVAVLFIFVVLPHKSRLESVQTISFKNCHVYYRYWDKGYVTDIDRAAQNKLGLCLCSLYNRKKDTALSNHIQQIYNQYGNHFAYDSTKISNNVDSIIKHKSVVLDTVIIVE